MQIMSMNELSSVRRLYRHLIRDLVLRQIGRRDIEGAPSRRKLQPRIENGTVHPVLAFLGPHPRQANKGKIEQVVGQLRVRC